MLYDERVEYDEFQDAVVELARGGARVTKGNVALRLRIEPASAGAMLDRMARDGRLELDVDERTGEIFYEVRKKDGGATRAPGKAALAEIGEAWIAGKAAQGGVALPPDKRKKLGVGILLGGLLPGFGLAYSAPWPVVVGFSVVVALGVKIIGLIPLLSAFLLIPFVACCAIASGVLGGLYAWQYNQTGKRTPLGDEPVSPRQIWKRLRR